MCFIPVISLQVCPHVSCCGVVFECLLAEFTDNMLLVNCPFLLWESKVLPYHTLSIPFLSIKVHNLHFIKWCIRISNRMVDARHFFVAREAFFSNAKSREISRCAREDRELSWRRENVNNALSGGFCQITDEEAVVRIKSMQVRLYRCVVDTEIYSDASILAVSMTSLALPMFGM